jgi:hypothetical protein
MSSLAEKVYTQISPGGNSNDSLLNAAAEPWGRRDLSTFEMDVRDWALVVGVAYGIARSEDPFESFESVADRALEAARAAYARWAGAPSDPPERDQEMRAIAQAWDSVHTLIGYPRSGNPELDEALMKLDTAIGAAAGNAAVAV